MNSNKLKIKHYFNTNLSGQDSENGIDLKLS